MSSSTESLTGRVVRQGDSEFEAARLGWNQLYSSTPEAVVFCAETADVVNALTWARHNDIPVRVRSGRHCLEGWSGVDGGLVIDVSAIKSATIDPEAGTATVGAGLNQLEAVTALGAEGFAAPTGTEGSVGLAGATLGGGFGLLTRRFGMASDNLLAAEVVVAPAGGGATAVIADEHNNTDLLWALRGAGNGNFGVVTSLTYKIHPLTQAIHIVATWTGLDDLAAVFAAWQRSAPYVDDRLTSQLEISRDRIMLVGALASGPVADALQLLAPILSVGSPDVVTKDASWADIYTAFQIPTDDEPANWKFQSQFMSQPFPPEAVSIVGSFMSNAPTPQCNYFTNAFGGAVKNSEPPGGSVFAHRDALFYAEPGAGWGVRDATPSAPESLSATCLNWITEFGEALTPYASGAYVNVPNAGMPDWEKAYWGSNIDRLRTIKATYDPDSVFSFEQGLTLPG